MVDLHCHILQGVDDGADSMKTSLEMAETAVGEGISTIVATPHHQHPHFQNDGASVRSAVEVLNARIQEYGIPLTIKTGQEVRLYGEITKDLSAGDSLSLADSKYVLVEFPTSQIPAYTSRLFYELSSEGYIPVIAHPERNNVFKEQPDKLYELIKNGALSQLTTSSLTGHLGKDIKIFSQQLLEANLVHVIASDAHNVGGRTFRFREAWNEVEKLYGKETVFMMRENAQLIAEDKHVYMEPPEPVRKKKKRLFGIF
ncbi:tyrosine-protein phosphatase [Shouchella shacheensis]|uniref:tyrosine-protein phosphatase n=1 Tax=Shouchella shacheensis TaxID=1649580 RepID=UPI00073FCC86|nr:CpsB/CapC family capsule biosynthesis tyrosine phosphatase [Shouchella shacheensis]